MTEPALVISVGLVADGAAENVVRLASDLVHFSSSQGKNKWCIYRNVTWVCLTPKLLWREKSKSYGLF